MKFLLGYAVFRLILKPGHPEYKAEALGLSLRSKEIGTGTNIRKEHNAAK